MKDTNAAALKTLINPCHAWLLSMEASPDAFSVTPVDNGTDVGVAVFVPF